MFYLAKNSDNPMNRNEAECLVESESHVIGGFYSLFCMIIWYDLLSTFNIVSKTLQLKDMDIDLAIFIYKGMFPISKARDIWVLSEQ